MNPRGEVNTDPRRSLPAVDRLVRALEGLTGGPPLWALREAAREVLEAERERLGRPAPAPSHARAPPGPITRTPARAGGPARPPPPPRLHPAGAPPAPHPR